MKRFVNSDSVNPRSSAELETGDGLDRKANGKTTMSAPSNRPCPLCQSHDGYSISNETWDILALGPIKIGFRLCSGCGLVLQDPAVPRERMLDHYAAFSNYTNPGRKGRSSPQKERNVARQIAFLEGQDLKVGRAFQVGCSDGYTLSEFARRGWQVDGIDPSASAGQIAHTQYGIKTRLGDFESAESLEAFDLFIATHVLEHVYDPIPFLEKIAQHLTTSGRLLLEVPCLVEPELWPNGYFSFEHVQYFSPKTLEACLTRAGFEILDSAIHTARLPYPVLCIVAKRHASAPRPEFDSSEYPAALRLVEQFMEREKRTGWQRIQDEILPRLDRYQAICIWGAGIHTSQLLARTNLSDRALRFIVDSDRQKVGRRMAGLDVHDPSRIEEEGIDAVLISTLGSESAVYESTKRLRERGIDVIRLYGDADSEER